MQHVEALPLFLHATREVGDDLVLAFDGPLIRVQELLHPLHLVHQLLRLGRLSIGSMQTQVNYILIEMPIPILELTLILKGIGIGENVIGTFNYIM